MECQRRRAHSLVVLTLLQLCRAEIKDAQPQWYSANIINEGFQPKSISELFSTETPFSTANPIIVSSNTNDDIQQLSTLAPPTSLSSSATFKTTSESSQLSSFSPTQSPLPQYSSTPSPFQQYITGVDLIQQTYQPINQPTVEIQQQTSPADFAPMQPLLKIVSDLQSLPQRNVQIQQEQSSSTQSLSQSPSATTFFQPQSTETTPQDMRFELFPQNSQTSVELGSSTARPPQVMPPQPNYFLIYQQAPQSVQSYPNRLSPRATVGEETFTTRVPPISSTFSPTFSSPPPITSTFSPTFTSPSPITSTFSSTFSSPTPTFPTISSFPVTQRTTPLFLSTTQPPSTQFLSSASPRVTVTSLSTIGSSSSIGSSTGTRNTNCRQLQSTTPLPTLNSGGSPIPIDKLFPLKIRVITPSGSITNVNFKPQITAQKSVAPTTTRKPTTRRTPRPRKNTYERCLQGCRKNGQALCAAPLSQFPVDPKTLRGFPSVCHMACHNSYRKDAFEKLIDGSCSKLRTRIRPVDSKTKLKRDELEKVQYFIDNSGQQAVLEFAGAYS